MLEFMKLYADMEQLFEPYSQEEKGNLLDAMMAYCFKGEEPNFTGNERFIWPVLRRHFDQCTERAETLRANAAKGGRPKNQTKPNETKENQEKPNETKKKLEQEQEQEQEHKQEQEQEQEQYNAPATDDRVIAFDGSDLTEDIHRYDLADSMIRTYGMVDSDTTRDALIEDLAKYGEAKMREVLKKAAMSNSRAKVSVSFYRTILEDKGGKSRAAPDYQRRQYDDNYFSSIEVNLDAG